jgi:hypothetical protein
MFTGYKAEHPFSSFDVQLELYQGKIDQAENHLKAMVFYKTDANVKTTG